MITFVVMTTSLGFFLLYNTSKKAVLSRTFALEKWTQDHPRSGKYWGIFLFSIAMAASITCFGTGAGIFLFFVILMAIGSLIVIIAPLRYIHYHTLLIVLLLSLTVEVILS